jgi:3-hydroxyacyl-CoA dehydrogenase
MRDKVLVIGGGRMGCGIAAVRALAGNKTVIVSVSSTHTGDSVQKACEIISFLADHGLATKENAKRAAGLLESSASLDDSCKQAFFVIEAVIEDLEIKQQLFLRLDSLLPEDVIIASNTSGLRITEIAALTKHPERTVTTHFWFPAHLVPLVEVVMGDKTSCETAAQTRDLLAGWNKEPVIVKKDLPGQLANRILQAMIREASYIVESGLATAEDVDRAIKNGPGIRLPVWGILEHVDAVGLKICKPVQDRVLPGLYNEGRPTQLMERLYEGGDLGYAAGKGFYDWSKKSMEALEKERDEFLIAECKRRMDKKKL